MHDDLSVAETDFKTKFEAFRMRAETAIRNHLPPKETRPSHLHQAMLYSMEAGGKRLRPVLLLAVSETIDGGLDPDPAAAAVECLHTYSLIHDDLPAMDDGDTRRGRPSCHRQFDEATAILAGDALLTHAFNTLARGYRDHPRVALALIETLGLAADSEHLIGGQMEDILGESRQGTKEDLEYIHLNKTAALMQAATSMGAQVAEASDDQISTAADLGLHLGLAFQIIDDILDATATPETMGKQTGADEAAEKTTYVSLYGVAAARAAAHAETRLALEACRKLPGRAPFLADLIDWMEHRIH